MKGEQLEVGRVGRDSLPQESFASRCWRGAGQGHDTQGRQSSLGARGDTDGLFPYLDSNLGRSGRSGVGLVGLSSVQTRSGLSPSSLPQ